MGGRGFCVNPCVWVGVLCVIKTIEVLGLWSKSQEAHGFGCNFGRVWVIVNPCVGGDD